MRINIYFTLKENTNAYVIVHLDPRINLELTSNNKRTHLFVRNLIFRTDLLEITTS